MKIQRIDWDITQDDLDDMQCDETVYRAQRQKGGNIDVLYVFWDGEEHRCFGARHDSESFKNLGDTTDNSFLYSIHQAIESGEKAGISLSEVMGE